MAMKPERKRVAVVLAVLCLPSCTGTAQVAHKATASRTPLPTCSPQHVTGAAGGPGPSPLLVTLDHYTYHRIPTSVRNPAKVAVVFTAPTTNVRIMTAEAVIVQRGVDIGNGPFTHHIPMLRDALAQGQQVSVTLPATNSVGRPLPAGQYLWGVRAKYVLTGPCPSDRALGAQTGAWEMPFLVVRAPAKASG